MIPCAICRESSPSRVIVLVGHHSEEYIKERCSLVHMTCMKRHFHACRQKGDVLTCPLCKDRITHINGFALISFDEESLQCFLLGALQRAEVKAISAFFTMGSATMNMREILLHQAIRLRVSKSIRTILDDGPVSPEALEYAVELAACNSSVDLLKMLMAQGPISDDSRSRSIVSSVQRGYVEAVRYLLSTGKISEKDRGWAVVCAVQKRMPETLKILLSSGSISSYSRGEAMEEAARENSREIVLLLAQGGPIPFTSQDMSIQFAHQNENGELEHLLQTLSVAAPDEDSELPLMQRGSALSLSSG